MQTHWELCCWSRMPVTLVAHDDRLQWTCSTCLPAHDPRNRLSQSAMWCRVQGKERKDISSLALGMWDHWDYTQQNTSVIYVQRDYDILRLLHTCCLGWDTAFYFLQESRRQHDAGWNQHGQKLMLLKKWWVRAIMCPMPGRCFRNAAVTLHIAYKQLEVRLMSFHILVSPSSYCPVSTS